LRALVGRRHRVILAAEGWPVIPGRYGRIEHYDALTMALSIGCGK
jgi:hypothetical protein